MADAPVVKVPTIEELRRAYEEGLPQTLLSGVQVLMRPLQPDKLLELGNIPDILTPIMLKGLRGDVTQELNAFLMDKRDNMAETMEMVKAVNAVCKAALVDPSITDLLTLSDRMWIFKLAFMPAEVLSTFRLQPRRDVEDLDDKQGQPLQTEPVDASDGIAVQAEPADSVPV